MSSELRVQDANCIWREYVGPKRTTGLKSTLNSFLYHKYASSQNYYYTKDLNDIITDTRAAPTFIAKDWTHFDAVKDSY